MNKLNKVPRYIYIVGVLGDYILSGDKAKFLLNHGELDKYCKSLIREISDKLYNGSNCISPEYLYEILLGKNGEEAQLRVVLELPEYVPPYWISERVKSAWQKCAVTRELLFAEIFEAFSMDETFLFPDWNGHIRGVQVDSSDDGEPDTI